MMGVVGKGSTSCPGKKIKLKKNIKKKIIIKNKKLTGTMKSRFSLKVELASVQGGHISNLNKIPQAVPEIQFSKFS